jgi:hypothetical protein
MIRKACSGSSLSLALTRKRPIASTMRLILKLFGQRLEETTSPPIRSLKLAGRLGRICSRSHSSAKISTHPPTRFTRTSPFAGVGIRLNACACSTRRGVLSSSTPTTQCNLHSNFFTSQTLKSGQIFVGSHYSINSVIHRPHPNTNGLIPHRTIVALQMSRLRSTREPAGKPFDDLHIRRCV